MKILRDFNARDKEDRESLLMATWCDVCEEADLGMVSPAEYEEDGEIYVEGRCAVCGASVTTIITDVAVSE